LGRLNRSRSFFQVGKVVDLFSSDCRKEYRPKPRAFLNGFRKGVVINSKIMWRQLHPHECRQTTFHKPKGSLQGVIPWGQVR
jgi:hypothetical protein